MYPKSIKKKHTINYVVITLTYQHWIDVSK